ncbi:hypothetical protein F4780DRAFT_755165 [Xylariomycetidae sp. FL0641]|nr:hypothetical protein F4780DRAFT_755165 [Xylariomycetidae sp. FL0641]
MPPRTRAAVLLTRPSPVPLVLLAVQHPPRPVLVRGQRGGPHRPQEEQRVLHEVLGLLLRAGLGLGRGGGALGRRGGGALGEGGGPSGVPVLVLVVVGGGRRVVAWWVVCGGRGRGVVRHFCLYGLGRERCWWWWWWWWWLRSADGEEREVFTP